MEIDFKSFETLKNYLLTMKNSSIIPSGRELKMSCPFCGDSRSDPYAASFYINIDKNSESFLSYNCFRASCRARGIINEDFFNKIGFSSDSIEKNIYAYLKNKNIKVGGRYINKTSKKLYNVVNGQSEVNEKKLAYINKRLGLNLSNEDLCDMKINLSFNELCSANDVHPDISERKYSLLDRYGICFISAYNDYVIIRDATKSNRIGMRYTNVNIFNNYENVTKAYIIPTKLDLLSSEKTVINIAEGVFDILSVYYNLNIDTKYDNKLYVAACGAGISKVIINLIKEYGLLNCKINIFSDSDVQKENYSDLLLLKKYLNKFDVTIYYNELYKDFGVPLDQIKIIKSKL